jgi:hypothetical protein
MEGKAERKGMDTTEGGRDGWREGGREGRREGGREGRSLGVVMRGDENVVERIQLLHRELKFVPHLPFVLMGAFEVCEGLADDDLGRKEGREGGREGGREVRRPGWKV